MLSLLEKAGLCGVLPGPLEEEKCTGIVLWSRADIAFLCGEPGCLDYTEYLCGACAEAHWASERLCRWCCSWKRAEALRGRGEVSANNWLEPPEGSLGPTVMGSLELLGSALEICVSVLLGGEPRLEGWGGSKVTRDQCSAVLSVFECAAGTRKGFLRTRWPWLFI